MIQKYFCYENNKQITQPLMPYLCNVALKNVRIDSLPTDGFTPLFGMASRFLVVSGASCRSGWALLEGFGFIETFTFAMFVLVIEDVSEFGFDVGTSVMDG